MEENFGFHEELNETEFAKCDGCGANMVYDPARRCLYCKHCGNERAVDTTERAEELNIISAFSAEENYGEEATMYRCDNCGAQVVLPAGQTANSCPFCGTAHVTKSEELAGLKPSAIIPFKVSIDNAVANTKAWAKKKFYAPRKFKKNLSTENVKGIYVPAFTFDSYTTSTYVGRIGITKVRTVGSGKNRKVYTYTEWRNISGTYYNNFDDVLVSSGDKFNQAQMDKLAPFDTNNAVKYDEEYMLGFMAYKYDYDVNDCWSYAKTRIDNAIRSAILSQYTYDKVDYLNVSTSHERVTYKYEMIPVYVGNFNYSKKLYNFYVNGENGRVHGKTPKSALKIILTVLLGIAVVAFVALLANL